MKRRRFRRARLFLILVLPLLLAALVWLRLAPEVEELAAAQVADEASDEIAEAITEQMEQNDITYGSVVTLEKDGEGKLLALRTDMNTLNRLRNETLRRINDRIAAEDQSALGIPLGSVFLPALFSGRGPRLPVRVLTIRNADAEYSGSFQEAGINQTLHRITLHVALDVTMLSPAGTKNLRVESEVVVAETVLVGQVPGTMIETNRKVE